MFSVYDMDCMGLADQFMANAFLKFGDIPEASPSGEKPKALVNMVLSRPEDEGKFEGCFIVTYYRKPIFISFYLNSIQGNPPGPQNAKT